MTLKHVQIKRKRYEKKRVESSFEKSLGHKKWQVTYIAPLNHVPLLCSHPGGLAGAGRIRLAAANVIVILM